MIPLTTPNGLPGRIVLAKPALTDNELSDQIYQGWLYAAVVDFSGGNLVQTRGSGFIGLYMTKDFGQTWTQVAIPAQLAETPNNNNVTNPTSRSPGRGTIVGTPFSLGNFALSLAVDPNNANVVYLGGTSEFRAFGLIRVDTTGIRDAHAFYVGSNSQRGPADRRRGQRRHRPNPAQGIGPLPALDPIRTRR